MAALLVSLHDVSPLTLDSCQRAVTTLAAAGVPASALTCLVIPEHEGTARLDADAATVRWLRGLRDDGAELVMHGLTHRMEGRARSPAAWLWAHGFARGCGEFYRLDRAETERRLTRGREILHAAGLEGALSGFVPPAWLLSPAARDVVAREFGYYEVMSGIMAQSGLCARRLIGWGSLSEPEACATGLWAELIARKAPADTRLAVHPQDVDRPSTRRAAGITVARLVERLQPLRYADYLAARSAQVQTA